MEIASSAAGTCRSDRRNGYVRSAPKFEIDRELELGWLSLVEIDDLDPVAIGVVEIGVPAGERGVPLVGIFDEFDAAPA
jgi:hypothetical protein